MTEEENLNNQEEAEEAEEEEEIAAQLAAEQELNTAQQTADRYYREGQNYKHPSRFKYLFLIIVALIVDLVDFADLTVFGILISKLVSVAGTGIIAFTLWLTDARVKRAGVYGEELAGTVKDIQKKIRRASRLAMKTSRGLRKIGMKKTARRISRGLVKVRRVMRRNPITKVLLGGAVNLVPFLAVLNQLWVWVLWSYYDESKTYKEARGAADDLSTATEGGAGVGSFRDEKPAATTKEPAFVFKKSLFTGKYALSKKGSEEFEKYSKESTERLKRGKEKFTTASSTTASNVNTPTDINQPAQKSGPLQLARIPTAEEEAEKIGKMREADGQDWRHDKSVDEAMKMRQQRMEVGERMGISKEESYRQTLEAERADDERRYKVM